MLSKAAETATNAPKTDAEPSSPRVQKLERKAEKAHERLDAAREKLPTHKVLKKERVFDEEKGKATTRLSFEDELKKPKGQSKLKFETDKTVRKVGDTLASGIHGKIHEVEQENSAVEAAHRSEIVAEAAIRHYSHHQQKSANKPYEKVSKLEHEAQVADAKLHYEKNQQEHPEMKNQRNMNKHYQKQNIKKEYAAARKAGSQTASNAATKNTGKKFSEKAANKIKEFFTENKKVFVWIGLGVMILVLLAAGVSSCTAMFSSTDHHAIIPTVQLEKQNISELPESEQKVIRLVSMRLLCATGEKHIYDETSVTLSCEGYAFKAKGKTVVQDGWKAIEQRFKNSLKDKEAADDEKAIPSFKENDIIHSVSASVTEHFTSPPKAFTEDTLLSAMETAGNEDFEDDTEKKGLGTPATRAGIIEKLVRSGFAERKGKSLVPTKDGINLVAVLPEQITSPTMTAEWENTLMQIERGKADADKFLAGIVDMTTSLIKAYPFLSDAEANRFESGKEVIGKCPRCGSPVYVGKGNYYCSSKSCSFCLWEDNKFFSSKKKKLTKKIAKELLDKGWCRVTGLYTPKKPQLYDAVIRLDDTGGKYVSFKMEFDR